MLWRADTVLRNWLSIFPSAQGHVSIASLGTANQEKVLSEVYPSPQDQHRRCRHGAASQNKGKRAW